MDKTREAFEACADKAGYGDFRRDPEIRDVYLVDEVQSAWAVWQAISAVVRPEEWERLYNEMAKRYAEANREIARLTIAANANDKNVALLRAFGRNYYAPDGTFMNADGTRSIFDDVDE